MRIQIVVLGFKGLERVSDWNLCVLSSVLNKVYKIWHVISIAGFQCHAIQNRSK